MKTMMKVAGLAVAIAAFASAPLWARQDKPGSKDHPLFTRMPGYSIENYYQAEFDQARFEGKDRKPTVIEGRKTQINYRPSAGTKPASPVAIGRNYQNAIAKIGGTVMFEELASGGGLTTMKVVRGTDEIWVRVAIGDSGNNYEVVIVEKAAMQQEVIASADAWKSDIGATGHAAVYGIYFDPDKSVIKPESDVALKEVAKLLQQNPNWSVLVVGHTDSTGDLAHNMALSEARAKAVVAALTMQFGIAAARLSAYGCGPLAPVASNKTDAGKAKNRRVELVER